MFLTFVAPYIRSRCRRKHFQTVYIVNRSLDSEANSNVQYSVRHLRKNTVKMSSRNTAVLCVLSRLGKQRCGLTATKHRDEKYSEIGRKHPFSAVFPILEIVTTSIRHYLGAVQKNMTVGDSCIGEDMSPTPGTYNVAGDRDEASLFGGCSNFRS